VSETEWNISTENTSDPFSHTKSPYLLITKKNQINTKWQSQHIKRGQHNPKPLEGKLNNKPK